MSVFEFPKGSSIAVMRIDAIAFVDDNDCGVTLYGSAFIAVMLMSGDSIRVYMPPRDSHSDANGQLVDVIDSLNNAIARSTNPLAATKPEPFENRMTAKEFEGTFSADALPKDE